jgi:Rod binding domain-containing protein
MSSMIPRSPTNYTRSGPAASTPAERIAQIDRDAWKIARGFESAFCQRLIESMRSTIEDSGLCGDGISSQYEDLFWHSMGEQIGGSGGLGFAEQIQPALREQILRVEGLAAHAGSQPADAASLSARLQRLREALAENDAPPPTPESTPEMPL